MDWYWSVNVVDPEETHHSLGTFRSSYPAGAISLAEKISQIKGKYYAFRNEPERLAALERLKESSTTFVLPAGAIFAWKAIEQPTQHFSVLQAIEPILVAADAPNKAVLVLVSEVAKTGDTLMINPRPGEIKPIPDSWYYGNSLCEHHKEFLARVIHEVTIRLSPDEDLGAWEKLSDHYKLMLKTSADTVVRFFQELFI